MDNSKRDLDDDALEMWKHLAEDDYVFEVQGKSELKKDIEGCKVKMTITIELEKYE